MQFLDLAQGNYKAGVTRSHSVAKFGSSCGSQNSNLECRWTYWTEDSSQTGRCAAKQPRAIKDGRNRESPKWRRSRAGSWAPALAACSEAGSRASEEAPRHREAWQHVDELCWFMTKRVPCLRGIRSRASEEAPRHREAWQHVDELCWFMTKRIPCLRGIRSLSSYSRNRRNPSEDDTD
ncbi:hypothetical protein DdX_09333 [Ditylenchus destructor]|uniref:Uncharacterized protein n=1 Tax=Ditylenchus destructor TaxID=166010 RepID=A0AAD4N0V9_9BILA|nr:hypothetical protein DdX_09333 [Ditylenchus destructor]